MEELCLQFSSAPSNTSNHKRVDIPLGDLLVFDVENKNQNRLIFKVQKLGSERK